MSTQPGGVGPALDGSGRTYDQINLVGITATGFHGVFDQERREGQVFRADVVVHLDTRRAAATDDLALTVDYGELATQVAAVLSGEPVDLIETVAERVAATALAYAAVAVVDVSLHKPQAPVTVPFDDIIVTIRRDRREVRAEDERLEHDRLERHRLERDDAERDRLEQAPTEPAEIVLALGSNLGAPQDTLRAAVAALADVDGIEVVAVSPLARTEPVGGPVQPDYLNAVVLARTTLAPRALLRATQAIEHGYGRVRNERWGPRTLDIDLIVYGEVLAVTDDLELPHPRAHERAFVLQPWAEIAPDAVLPGLGGGPVAVLAATAPDRGGIRWLALDWFTAPQATSLQATSPQATSPQAAADPTNRDADGARADGAGADGADGADADSADLDRALGDAAGLAAVLAELPVEPTPGTCAPASVSSAHALPPNRWTPELPGSAHEPARDDRRPR